MKKIYCILIIFGILIFNIQISAATPNYTVGITETSSISDDFKNIGIDISNYNVYEPNYVDYLDVAKHKIELIDFQVAILAEEYAQIYLYIYDAYLLDTTTYFQDFFVSFDIENYDFPDSWVHNNYHSNQVAYDSTHGVIKLKSYKFKYSESNNITITSIIAELAYVMTRITCYPNMTKEIVFKESLLPEIPTPPAESISLNTSISDDFKNMNMDINDYYISKSYDYSKWYMVAVGFEVLADGKLQSYFYIYNPKQTAASAFEIYYRLNNNVAVDDYFLLSKTDASHGLYKVQGIVLDPSLGNYKLCFDKIISTNTTSESEFEIEINCSKSSSTEISITTNFDTTIIIDECSVVEVEINKDSNFINNWNAFWSNRDTSMLVYFYNFNFPDHIEYESVEYAKFQYYYMTYYEEAYITSNNKNKLELISKEKVVSEYTNGSKTLRVNDNSQEMTFPTFYLGNRVNDRQFGTWDVSFAADTFDYDCSVLLDSTYKIKEGIPGQLLGVAANVGWKYNYTTLDQVEIIELHYKNDGVLYKAQVVSNPIDNEDFEHINPIPEVPWWQQFLIWLGKKTVHMFSPTTNWPDWGYMIVGGIESFVLLVVTICLLPLIISLLTKIITLPFKLIVKIFNL